MRSLRNLRGPHGSVSAEWSGRSAKYDQIWRKKKMSREAELEKEGISLLGNQNVKYPDQYAPEILETFLNKHPGNVIL